jgi:hypothetical protein
MSTISMDTLIFGMAIRGRTIYYCTLDKGIMMLNLSDKSVSDIINSNMTAVYYVATSGEKRGHCITRSSLNSHCVVPCKSQHVTVCFS